MLNTIPQYMANVSDPIAREALRHILEGIGDRYSCVALTSAGLVIKAGASALAKSGAAITYFLVKGKQVALPASTDMPALTPLQITAAKFNVACFFIDIAGALSVAVGQEGAAAVNVKFPQFPKGKALVGWIMVTYASAFVGGTTALDTATTIYVSPIGPSDPSVLA